MYIVVRLRSQLCCLDYLLASLPPVPRQENCPPADLMLFLRGGHYKEVSNDRFSTEGCLKSVNVTAKMDQNLNILQAMFKYIFIFFRQLLRKKERLQDYSSTWKWISLTSGLWWQQSSRLDRQNSKIFTLAMFKYIVFSLEQPLRKKDRLCDNTATWKWISLPSCLWRPQSWRLGKTLSRNSVALWLNLDCL